MVTTKPSHTVITEGHGGMVIPPGTLHIASCLKHRLQACHYLVTLGIISNISRVTKSFICKFNQFSLLAGSALSADPAFI